MIGTTLYNRYRIDALLGQGGMGAVYRAYDERLERDVAIKVLNNQNVGTQGRARLLQEARAVARLNHPNIVSIYDAEESDGISFVVMELVKGKTLREQKTTSLQEAVWVARQVCKALDHAHGLGIIHRDLKPENIMMEGTRVKLMDFGLARSVHDPSLSQSGMVVGTPAYIAPEQIVGDTVDARADLYSLGIILYELATGQPPFSGQSLASVISKHLNTLPEPPTLINADLPFQLENVILRLLAKKPEDRFESAAHLLAELDALPQSRENLLSQRALHNLPAEITSFVGRTREVAEVAQMINSSRLVTLTGSGGIGKSRLSLQAARSLLPAFADGVWLVELAPLSDPQQLTVYVVTALGIRRDAADNVQNRLDNFLLNKQLLLILDNCEHLTEACAQLADHLLRACPRLKILATSREQLGISGESPYRVPSLSIPRDDPTPEELLKFEAVWLFVERAQAANQRFGVDAANAAALAQICRRLDGIPLALELAAARVSVLKAEQIAARLDDRFRLLTGGSRTALPRQQTLRAMIDWSWDLLNDPERTLLRRLSAFVGGWKLEAAEQVCADGQLDSLDILDLLTSLLNKSLVVTETGADGETRYRLLETIRQYAREKLIESGDAIATRDRHLRYYTETVTALKLPTSLLWPQVYRQLVEEVDNLTSALEWSLDGNVESGLWLMVGLNQFWRSYSPRDGISWFRQFLLKPEAQKPDSLRANALYTLAFLGHWAMPLPEAQAYAEESLALFQQLADEPGQARAMVTLSRILCLQDQYSRGKALALQSLAIYRKLGHKAGLVNTLDLLGYLADNKNQPQTHRYTEEALALYREMGYFPGIRESLSTMAVQDYRINKLEQARVLIEEAYQLTQQYGAQSYSLLYYVMGGIALRQRRLAEAASIFDSSIDYLMHEGLILAAAWEEGHRAFVDVFADKLDEALARFRQCQENFYKLNSRIGVVFCQEGVLCVLARRERYADALALYTWTNVMRHEVGDTRPLVEQLDLDHYIETIRANLDEAAIQAAQARGEALTIEQAMQLAWEQV